MKKIMEEHGGRMRLDDAEGGGAQIHLRFPATRVSERGDKKNNDEENDRDVELSNGA